MAERNPHSNTSSIILQPSRKSSLFVAVLYFERSDPRILAAYRLEIAQI
jgi:hypothetical protein